MRFILFLLASAAHAESQPSAITMQQGFTLPVISTTPIITSPNGSLTVTPGTGTWAGSGSYTVTPGTGSWQLSTSSTLARQDGSYTETPGTGTWPVSGAFNSGPYTVTPGTGSWPGQGSYTVTPGTGTWPGQGSYTVTAGTGAWPGQGSYTVTPGTGAWPGQGSYTVTPGTGTFPTSGTFNSGTYTVTPGTGAWAGQGSYTVTPGTGAFPIGGSLTVTPGTGTFATSGAFNSGTYTVIPGTVASNQNSYTVTPGSGTWPGAVNGSVTVTPGTGTWAGSGSYTVTPGTGNFSVNGSTLATNALMGRKITYSLATSSASGQVAIGQRQLISFFHNVAATKRVTLQRLDVNYWPVGVAQNGAMQMIELWRVTTATTSAGVKVTPEIFDQGDAASIMSVTSGTITGSTLAGTMPLVSQTLVVSSTQTSVSMVDPQMREGKLPVLRASTAEGWAIVHTVTTALSGGPPMFYIRMEWTEE